jgi:hypothetical protein
MRMLSSVRAASWHLDRAFRGPGLMSAVRAAVRVSLDKTTMWDDPTLLSPNTLASFGSDLRYTETDFGGATPKRSAKKSSGARRRLQYAVCLCKRIYNLV